MKKAIIIYGTETGNTKMAAGVIKEILEGKGLEVDEKNVSEADMNDTADYDLVLLGASTWGEGDIQSDFLPFYDDMDERLKNRRVAVFGCGDSDMFPHCFCEAVDKIQSKAEECGAEAVSEPCKIDGEVDGNIHAIKEWAQALEA